MDGAEVTRDWSAAFSHYLLTVSQQSARSLDLSYAVLRRIADGALTAETVGDLLAAACDGYREQYAAELTRVLAAFARELQSELTADCTRTGVDTQTPAHQRHLDLMTRLAELSARLQEQCIGVVLSAGRLTGAPAITLRGAVGERPSASLIVENTRSEPAVLTCVLLDVRRADGGAPAFTADARVHITSSMLEPGGEAEVELTIHLDPARFTATHGYVSALRLLRDGDAPLDLPIAITPIASPTPGE